MWWVILIAVLAAFFALVFVNLRAGEKQIRYQLTHRFSVEDPINTEHVGCNRQV
jgi:hypothetical protein